MTDFSHSLSLQPTPGSALGSAFAVDIKRPAWLEFWTLGDFAHHYENIHSYPFDSQCSASPCRGMDTQRGLRLLP